MMAVDKEARGDIPEICDPLEDVLACPGALLDELHGLWPKPHRSNSEYRIFPPASVERLSRWKD
jgi:hypothetical protein